MTVSDPLTKRIPLMETFGPTISGEGALIGQQTYFLRFGGCDYRCKMCDSMHAVDPEQIKANAKWLTQDEIFSEFVWNRKPETTNWLTLSGGNPCIHNLEHLTFRLCDAGINLAVETQGTIPAVWLKNCRSVTVSPKGPGMGEQFDENVFDTFMAPLRKHMGCNIKIVIFDQADIEFAERIVGWCLKRSFPLIRMYLSQGNPYPPGGSNSPVDMNDHVASLRMRYLKTFELLSTHKDLSRVKFLPQFHVWLWSNKQGV